MAQRNVRNFIDRTSLPFIVNIPFTGLTVGTSPLTVDSGVISTERDFYGFIIRSSGSGAFQFKLTDGEGVDLSAVPIDALSNTGAELIRNLGDSGRLIPIFAPKGSKITVVLSTILAGPIDGTIEIQGETILG